VAHETLRLAEYAAKLRYQDVPADVVQRAKDTITDAVGTIVFGYDLPWSRIIVAHARRSGPGGKSRILGLGGPLVQAPSAAFANGALAHAFELDNLTKPGSGVHPGAILLSAGLAVAQERGFTGRDLLTAFVAGSEVMIRIGRATKHTNEARGFHAPGTTGPFGGARCHAGFSSSRSRGPAPWSSGSISAARPKAACSPPVSRPTASRDRKAYSRVSSASCACSAATSTRPS
jgi:2-methylcitrate dehydratase PrpD